MASRVGRSLSVVAPLLTTLLLAGCNSPVDLGRRVFGYVDTQGRIVIAPVYQDAQPFHEGRAAVKGPAGWGFIDAQGHWVVEGRYRDAESFSDGRARVRDPSGTWGYVDRAGVPVIPPQFTCESPFFGGHAIVQPAKGRVQVIDAGGHIVRELAGVELADVNTCGPSGEDLTSGGFSAWVVISAASDEDWLAALQQERLLPAQSRTAAVGGANVGYLDPDGNWAIAPAFSEAGSFVEGRARVQRDGKVGFIDRTGQVVVPFDFEDALLRFSGDRTVALRDRHAWLIDGTGKQVADLGTWRWPGLGEGEDFDSLKAFVGLSDFFAGGPIPWPTWQVNRIGRGLELAKGRWGYVGLDGKWVVQPQYDSAQPFHGGFANVQIGDRWILIDVQGRRVAEPDVGWIGPRDGLLTRAGTSTRWGFAGEDDALPHSLPFATIRVDFGTTSFVDARPLQFSEGLAAVSQIARPSFRLIDERGRTRAKGRFEGLAYLGRERLSFLDDERWGLMDTHFRVLVPARFDARPTPSDNPNEYGLTLVPTTFSRDGYVFARSQGLGGCIDQEGRWAFSPQPLISATCEGPVMPVRTSTGKGAMGMDGSWRISPKYDEVSRLDDRPEVFLKITKDEQTQIVRVTERGVRYSAPGLVSTVCSSSRLCMLKVGEQWQRLDPESLEPTGLTLDDVNPNYGEQGGVWGLRGAAVRKGARWGYLAGSGELTVPMAYDELVLNYETGTEALVRQGPHWGVVSLTGQPLVAIRFDELKPAARGYYAMRVGTQWGIVDARGREIIAPRFDQIQQAANGLMLVREGGRSSLMTVHGIVVLQPPPEWMQLIRYLYDHSAESWSALTTDRRLYFIDKRTLATHELRAPEGYSWGQPGSDYRVMYVRPDASSDEKKRAVLVNEAGDLVVHEVFENAEWSRSANRFTVWRRGRCGMIGLRGHWVVPMHYDDCIDIEKPAWAIVGDDAQ